MMYKRIGWFIGLCVAEGIIYLAHTEGASGISFMIFSFFIGFICGAFGIFMGSQLDKD